MPVHAMNLSYHNNSEYSGHSVITVIFIVMYSPLNFKQQTINQLIIVVQMSLNCDLFGNKLHQILIVLMEPNY